MAEEASAVADIDAEVKKVADKVAGFSLKQAVDFKNYMKEQYGIEPAAGGAVMVAGGAAGPAEAAAEEQTEFDVIQKMSKEDADALKAKLEEAGATVNLK
jgi:large subunit ribosomal protein L7/L12